MKLQTIFLTGLYILDSFLTMGQDIQMKSNAKSASVILFICEHGAARSTIAAAYFNKFAREQGLNYQAIFRGNNPDSILAPAAKNGLVKDGFDVTGWKPSPVSNHDIENAYLVVTLDCVLSGKDSTSKHITKWKDISSISDDYTVARDEIVKKVQALVTELSQKNKEQK